MGECQAHEHPPNSRRQAQPVGADAASSRWQTGSVRIMVDAESRPCEHRYSAKVSEQHRRRPEAGTSTHATLGGHTIQSARSGGPFEGLPLHAMSSEWTYDQLVSRSLE